MTLTLYVLGCVMAHVANHMTGLVSRVKVHPLTHYGLVIFWPLVAFWLLFDGVWRVVTK